MNAAAQDNLNQSCRWAIVGGGMLGMTLAYRLAKAGQKVTLIEAGPELGGLASEWQLGEVTWDKHYHVTLLSDLRLRKLLAELELESKMEWVETKTGFYTKGKLYSMSSSWEFLRFPPLNLLEKARLALTILWASKIRNWKPLEKQLVADWLQKWSGAGTFHKIWLPLLQAKLGETYKRVSAAFIWATIARMYQARQSGLKKEMFGYVPGGYARVLKTFAERLQNMDVEVKTNCPVSKVSQLPGGTFLLESERHEDQQFDRVVLTVPSPVIAKVCPQLGEQEKSSHRGIEYLGILCASVLMKQNLAHYYVTNITDTWVPFTAVIEMTALVDPAEMGNRHLVYLPRYVSGDDPAWKLSDEELQDEFLAALEQMYPEFDRQGVEAFRVSRVKNVMALPTLDYSEQLPSMDTSLPGLFAVNSAQIVKGTLNVNEVIGIADAAFETHLLPACNPAMSTTTLPNHNCDHVPADRELVARS